MKKSFLLCGCGKRIMQDDMCSDGDAIRSESFVFCKDFSCEEIVM